MQLQTNFHDNRSPVSISYQKQCSRKATSVKQSHAHARIHIHTEGYIIF